MISVSHMQKTSLLQYTDNS